MRAYRLGHALVIDAAAEEVNAAGLQARIGLAVFERITSVSFRYIDWISQQVVVVCEAERDRWLANRNSTRALRVRELTRDAASVASVSTADTLTASAAVPRCSRTPHAVVMWWPADSELDDGLGRAGVRSSGTWQKLLEHKIVRCSSRLIATPAGVDTAVGRCGDDRSRGEKLPTHTEADSTPAGPLRSAHRCTASTASADPHHQAQRRPAASRSRPGPASHRAGDPGLAAATLIRENLDDARGIHLQEHFKALGVRTPPASAARLHVKMA